MALVALSGCLWSNPGYNAEGQGSNASPTGITAENVGSLGEAWHRDWSSSGGAMPVVESGAGLIHTFVGGDVPGDPTAAGTAVAMRPATGEIVWQAPVPRGNSAALNVSDVSMVDGSVAVSMPPECSFCSANTVRFDARTGAVLDDLADGTYVLGTPERVVSIWSQITPDIVRIGAIGVHPSASDPFSIYVLGNISRMAVGGDRAFFSSGTQLLGADLSPADTTSCFLPTSCSVGQADLDGDGTAPVLSSDHATVYVATSAGTLYAFAANAPVDGQNPTLALRWKASLGGAITARPALSADGLVVATTTGTVAVFDPDGCGATDCSPKWTTTVPGSVDEQPTIAGGLVYVGDTPSGGSTTLRAFSMDCTTGCESLWSADTGVVLSGPIVASDRARIFVSGAVPGAATARVVAYRPS